MSEQAQKNGKLITDAFLISVAPAFAYAVAYFFEVGYVGYYGIPEFFISVSLERFLYILSVLITMYVVSVYILDSLFVFFHEKLKSVRPVHYVFFFFLFLSTWYGIHGLVFVGLNLNSSFFLALGVIGFLCVYILPVFGKKSWNEYLNELNRIDDCDAEKRSKSLTSRLANHEKWGELYLIVTLVLVILQFSKILGGYIAYKEHSFLLAKINGADYVLIRSYGDNNIFVDFQRKWKNLYSSDFVFGSQVVIKKTSEQPLIFDRIKINPDAG